MSTHQDIGKVRYVPERRRDMARLVEAAVAGYQGGVLEAVETFLSCPSPESFLALEEVVLGAFQRMAAQVVAGVVSFLHDMGRWVSHAMDRARERMGVPSRHRGWRWTQVVFLGGLRLAIRTPYVSRDLRGRPGRRRGVGRRGENGTGCYPLLELLGIRHRVTPAVASEVARATVRMASFEEAHQALSERGIALQVGKAALAQRQIRLNLAAAGVTLTDEFAGKRLVLSADGGRLRLREGGVVLRAQSRLRAFPLQFHWHRNLLS